MTGARIGNTSVFLLTQFSNQLCFSSVGFIAVMDCTVTDLLQDPVRRNCAVYAYVTAAIIFLILGTLGRPLYNWVALSIGPREWCRFTKTDTREDVILSITSFSDLVAITAISLLSLIWFAGLVADGVATWNGPPVFSLAFFLGGITAVMMGPGTIIMRNDVWEFCHWYGSWSLRMEDDTYLKYASNGGTLSMTLLHPYICLNLRVREETQESDGQRVSASTAIKQSFTSCR